MYLTNLEQPQSRIGVTLYFESNHSGRKKDVQRLEMPMSARGYGKPSIHQLAGAAVPPTWVGERIDLWTPHESNPDQ